MRKFVWVWAVLLLSCSDNSTGSLTFAEGDLTITGNPSILGESAGTQENPSSFIRVGGVLDSKSGLPLTGLKIRVRVLGDNGVLLGTREQACTPESIEPGASCTFQVNVSLTGVSYTESRQIELTPVSDQGLGTQRLIPVVWPS